MTILYFVKAGPRPNTTGEGKKISLEKLCSCFPNLETMHAYDPPVINEDNPSLYAEHVVIETTKTNDIIKEKGFHLLKDIHPKDINLNQLSE
ncbi:MAG: hypothetical protein KJ630_00085 [Proteobacteria bacterium]|nr:hypothetical protein [Pseudomonadota bacterium]